MALPYFFVKEISPLTIMDEETSKHIVIVLRMKKGDEVLLTDGNGKLAQGFIEDDNRKKCKVALTSTKEEPLPNHHLAIGISLIKNAVRFEWFLEKATEIGVREIFPLLCERTEKEKFRPDRMNGIMISAMIQSRQTRIPRLEAPTTFSKMLQLVYDKKFIAHCLPGDKTSATGKYFSAASKQLILIGPEGDFTEEEIHQAVQCDFEAVSLGNNRLRTETAGVVAAVLLGMK